MSDSLELPGHCRFCNDLNLGSISQIPFDDWVSGISRSSCQTCQIIVQAIQKLSPKFLEGAFGGRIAGPHPELGLWLSVGENCRVVIGVIENERGGRAVSIQLYYSSTDTGEEVSSRIPQIGTAGDISLFPGDTQMWLFLQKCLNDCITKHEKCKAAQDSNWYPERLLCVAQDKSSKDILRLIQTKHHPPSSPYITLSHCWGSASPFHTNKKNFPLLLENISLSVLPRTFQDCVFAAQELGVQYIWIDSLCIVQDDRNDWARHAQSMDKIYENSLFTLAAVSSPNSFVPFLGPDAPSDRGNWQAINIDVDMGIMKSVSASGGSSRTQLKARRWDPYLYPTFFDGPLEHRGWAWQERYLSTRIIDFTQEEARWRCKTSETCECVDFMQSTTSQSTLDLEPAKGKGGKELLIRKWRDIVTDYSRRELTYSTDRLPAISGAASYFQSHLKSDYLAGIWLTDFPHSLAWYRRELNDCPTGKPQLWRSLDNGVPSWSWASVPQETLWIWDFYLKEFPRTEEGIALDSQIKLISINCRPSSDNTFGEVEAGSYIKLQGKVVEAEIESDLHSCACVRRKGFKPQHIVPDCIITSDGSSWNLMEHIRSGIRPKTTKPHRSTRRAVKKDRREASFVKGSRYRGDVYCLLLFTTTQNGKNHACILILGQKAGSSDTYQRLGIGNSDSGWSRPLYKSRKNWEIWTGWEELEEWEEWERWFKDAEVRTLTII
ncbi:heterokaryon incompatibility protein-domain-containing protein [Bisporella sp. PMI_857]|nr:heterokaryon incompatibility protein-domain-containing protein [Bisporella sp. PMI_857]